jgi:hypothetical protein
MVSLKTMLGQIFQFSLPEWRHICFTKYFKKMLECVRGRITYGWMLCTVTRGPIAHFCRSQLPWMLCTVTRGPIAHFCRSQLPCSLIRELSSPWRMLRVDSNPTWRTGCLLKLIPFVFVCVGVGLTKANPPSKESYWSCIRLWNRKGGQGPERV